MTDTKTMTRRVNILLSEELFNCTGKGNSNKEEGLEEDGQKMARGDPKVVNDNNSPTNRRCLWIGQLAQYWPGVMGEGKFILSGKSKVDS